MGIEAILGTACQTALALLIALASTASCSRGKSVPGQSTALLPSPQQAKAAQEMASRVSATLLGSTLDGSEAVFDLAPSFGRALSEWCIEHSCTRLAFVPRYPAGRGLVVTPRLTAGDEQQDFGEVFLRERGKQWELLDVMPHEIESIPRQFSVAGAVVLEPAQALVDVDVTIEVLAEGQRYLLFDFFDAERVPVEDLLVELSGQGLRHCRHGSLLIVEVPEAASAPALRFRYRAALPEANRRNGEFVLYENWLPYLGGRASFRLELHLPEGFTLGIPSQLHESSSPKRPVHLLEAEAADRYPIIGSATPYARASFDHQGVKFEILLRAEHGDRLSAVADAVRASMDSFEALGAFPTSSYRVLEASYSDGHGALGLQRLMVLGEELLQEKHLLPAVAHELSHAWFAGLLRDPQGRWSEGVASYLSQWPLSETRARLMRWGWLVAYEQVPAERDLALQGSSPAPRSAAGAAEAIFYGKAALVLQELEGRVGIAKMRQILSLFLYQYRGRSVRWREFQQAVADVTGNTEARRFGLWLAKASAPRWKLEDLVSDSQFVSGTLLQDSDFAFAGQILLATMNEQSEVLSTLAIEVSGQRTAFRINLPKEARWLVVDPNYSMPRRGGLDGRPSWMVRIRD